MKRFTSLMIITSPKITNKKSIFCPRFCSTKSTWNPIIQDLRHKKYIALNTIDEKYKILWTKQENYYAEKWGEEYKKLEEEFNSKWIENEAKYQEELLKKEQEQEKILKDAEFTRLKEQEIILKKQNEIDKEKLIEYDKLNAQVDMSMGRVKIFFILFLVANILYIFYYYNSNPQYPPDFPEYFMWCIWSSFITILICI